ncbi:MAG: hypothetical protein ACHQUB_02570 [Candidatus Saccharimonadia bacterium]
MGKKLLLSLAAVVSSFILFSYPLSAHAHTFRSDGPIRVLLHVDPDDTPIAGDASRLDFFLFDDTNKFQAKNCNCHLLVTLGNKVILDKSTFNDQNALDDNSFDPIVFPALGTYTIKLTGQPLSGNSFHAFTLNFFQRVDSIDTKTNSIIIWLIAGLTGIIVMLTLIALIVFKRSTSATPPNRHQTK